MGFYSKKKYEKGMDSKMEKNPRHKVPILFFNSSEEDRETFRFVLSSKMPCEFRAAAEKPTPRLLVGYQRFLGFAEIREFVSEHLQQNRLQAR